VACGRLEWAPREKWFCRHRTGAERFHGKFDIMSSKSSVAIERLVRTPQAKRMLEEMRLAGLAERTHETCLRAVPKLAAQTRTSPDQITEEQVRQCLLLLRNEKQFAPGSLAVAFLLFPGSAWEHTSPKLRFVRLTQRCLIVIR